MTDMEKQLNQYYECVGIAPVSRSSDLDEMFCAFQCKKKVDCREACRKAYQKASPQKENFLFEPRVEGVTVSQEYQDRKYHGDQIPRIVVLSLSAPQPNPRQYLSCPQSKEEQDNKPAENPKTYLDPDKHWSRTLVTVRSLLHPFIACENFPKPVEYWEDGKEIAKLFVHVRTAKCCSNADGSRQEPHKVYANCGGYLRKELSILKPDVIVTQGGYAHREAKRHAFKENAKKIPVEEVTGIETENLIARIVKLKEDERSVYWLKMTFPTKQWMWRWNKEAGPAIENKKNVVDAKRAMREHLMRYGEAIQDFLGIPNAKGPYPKRLERKESDKGMQSMPEVQATQKPDRLFNTNEKYAPGAYKKMFCQGVIATFGPWDDPRMLKGSTEGQRVFAYVNKKGILAVGYIVDSEPRLDKDTTVFGKEIEFHVKVDWETIVDAGEGVTHAEVKAKGYHLPVRGKPFVEMLSCPSDVAAWIADKLRRRAK